MLAAELSATLRQVLVAELEFTATLRQVLVEKLTAATPRQVVAAKATLDVLAVAATLKQVQRRQSWRM